MTREIEDKNRPRDLDLKLGSDVDDGKLDSIPRAMGRQTRPWSYFGCDLWNAYEVSFLTPSGLPRVVHMQARYDAESTHMVESKSLKLYLNRLNHWCFRDLEEFSEHVRQDLSACVGGPVSLYFHSPGHSPAVKPLTGQCIDNLELPGPVSNYDPNWLQPGSGSGSFAFHSHLLRTNCPVTGQPDWGSVQITGSGSRLPLEEGLLAYLVSFRNHQDFHETCCETIFMDLMACFKPEELVVCCHYTRRGGIDINPLRSANPKWTAPLNPVWRQ